MWTRLAAAGPIIFVDEVLARYRRHGGSDTSTRVRTGDNIRERVTAIGVLSNHLPPKRRAFITRRALAYAGVFAARIALRSARKRDWSVAAVQAREALRCLLLLPRGVPRLNSPADLLEQPS